MPVRKSKQEHEQRPDVDIVRDEQVREAKRAVQRSLDQRG